MNFNITQGPIQKAQKVILYGVEGIGKSTFLSHFPDPLFIDTEGSTAKLNVKRLDRPSSWIMLLDMIDYYAEIQDRQSPWSVLIVPLDKITEVEP